jgi:hypothetical protein
VKPGHHANLLLTFFFPPGLGALIAIYCAPIGGAGQGLISFTPSELECVVSFFLTIHPFIEQRTGKEAPPPLPGFQFLKLLTF